MNINNIIKRFQDIDRLKLILLNDNQRKLFEYIPKPMISKNSINYSKNFTLNLNHKKKSISHRINSDIGLSTGLNTSTEIQDNNNNSITRKILQMIDPKVINGINNSQEISF